jgi:hypothetical protein
MDRFGRSVRLTINNNGNVVDCSNNFFEEFKELYAVKFIDKTIGIRQLCLGKEIAEVYESKDEQMDKLKKVNEIIKIYTYGLTNELIDTYMFGLAKEQQKELKELLETRLKEIYKLTDKLIETKSKDDINEIICKCRHHLYKISGEIIEFCVSKITEETIEPYTLKLTLWDEQKKELIEALRKYFKK